MKLGRTSQWRTLLWCCGSGKGHDAPLMTSTCSNIQHTSSKAHMMRISGLEENLRNNKKALIILRNQIKWGRNGCWIGELGKIPKWVKNWIILCNCQATLRAQNQELLAFSLIFFFFFFNAASPKVLMTQKTLRKTGTNISELKTRYWKNFKNPLPNIFHAHFPFYLCTRVIYGKNQCLMKSKRAL